jgi:hypothetical protein
VPEHGIKDVPRGTDAGAIYSDGPINPSVGFEAAF